MIVNAPMKVNYFDRMKSTFKKVPCPSISIALVVIGVLGLTYAIRNKHFFSAGLGATFLAGAAIRERDLFLGDNQEAVYPYPKRVDSLNRNSRGSEVRQSLDYIDYLMLREFTSSTEGKTVEQVDLISQRNKINKELLINLGPGHAFIKIFPKYMVSKSAVIRHYSVNQFDKVIDQMTSKQKENLISLMKIDAKIFKSPCRY